MTFKNFIFNEEIKLNFCYMVYIDPVYHDQIGEIQYDISDKINKNAKFYEPKKLHTTIRYVKLKYSQDPSKFLQWIDKQTLPEFYAYTYKFSVFDDNVLVMELESPEIQNWYSKINSFLTNNGYAENQYKIYKPHISIVKNYMYENPPKFSLANHRVKLKFNIHKITNQNGDVIFQRNSDIKLPNLDYGKFKLFN